MSLTTSDKIATGVISIAFGGVALMFGTIIHNEHTDAARYQSELNAAFAPIIKQYDDQRLRNIIADQGANQCIEPSIHCKDAAEPYKELLNFKISLSSTLPGDAIIQVFKDRILINSHVPQEEQEISLRKVLQYTAQQRRDGQTYGDGECFTIGLGELQGAGKNGSIRPDLLLPTPSR